MLGRMETTLHRQLKERFMEEGSEIEVRVERYRIDVVTGNRLIEIQRSGLSSIRDKIRNLLDKNYRVEVVKPLVVRKQLVKLSRKNGKVVDRRWSPKRGTIMDVFDELLYFTRVFPHPNLRLICPMIEMQEIRYPGHGKRRRRRKGDFVVKDRLLTEIQETHVFDTAQDLHRLLPKKLPSPFDTKELAAGLKMHRGDAQKIAYVLRHTGSVELVGKRGNANLFELAKAAKKRRKKKFRAVKRAA